MAPLNPDCRPPCYTAYLRPSNSPNATLIRQSNPRSAVASLASRGSAASNATRCAARAVQLTQGETDAEQRVEKYL